MENNITNIFIKNSGKGVTLPLNSGKEGMALPLCCSLSLMTFTDDPAPALPPPPSPKKKRTFPK